MPKNGSTLSLLNENGYIPSATAVAHGVAVLHSGGSCVTPAWMSGVAYSLVASSRLPGMSGAPWWPWPHWSAIAGEAATQSATAHPAPASSGRPC